MSISPSPAAAVAPAFQSRRRPERRRVLQLILGVVVYAVSQVAMTAGAVLMFGLMSSGDASATVGEILAAAGPAAPTGFLVGAAVSVLGFFLVVRFVSRRRVAEFSLPGAGREFGWGLLIGVGIVAAAVGILALLTVYRVVSVQVGLGIVTGLMFGIGPAVMEEIFFRGFLLRILDDWVGSWSALIVASVLFALVHALSSPAGPIAALFVLISASLALNMAWFLTRRLWMPVALHLGLNAAQGALFGLHVSGNATGQGLFTADLVGPDLLTGGAVGGEGSLPFLVVALGVGIVLTVVAVRRGVMLPRVRR